MLENAVKYSEPGDAIEVSRARPGRVGRSRWRTRAAGSPPEAVDRIFDRFARADPARSRASGGVGLGLAIVDAIVKAHGGRCVVRSTGRGTTFTLVLPGFEPERDPAAAPEPLPEPRPAV